MKRPVDDKMTPRRLTALRQMSRGPIRLGEVDVIVRKALVGCERAILHHERGLGWTIAITESGSQALAEWEAQIAMKEKMWRVKTK